jgi:hypothetical protein
MQEKSVLAIACLMVVCGACSAQDPADPADDSRAEEEGNLASSPDVADFREIATNEAIGERIGETAQPSATGDACRAYCGASYFALCYRITTLCTGVTVITIGGTTVQCAAAVAATCLSASALNNVCSGRCPP